MNEYLLNGIKGSCHDFGFPRGALTLAAAAVISHFALFLSAHSNYYLIDRKGILNILIGYISERMQLLTKRYGLDLSGIQ